MLFKIISTCRNGDGYTYCRTEPVHPNANVVGLQALHRVVMENKLGRLLTPDEIVHHKDENKRNNHPDNLQVMTRAQHARHHAVPAKKITIACSGCGSPILIREKDYRFKIKYNKYGIHCTRSCAARTTGNLDRSKRWAASDSNREPIA